MKNVLPLFALIAFAFCVPDARAATLTVTTTADSGAGSLRAAIAAAAAGDTIQFAAALNGQMITLTSAEIAIDKDITLDGPGPSQLTVRRSSAGGIIFRIFAITPGHTVTIEGLTIFNGLAENLSPGDVGGGIFNNGSTLSVANCVVTGNSAIHGGGIYSGNAVASGSATLTISNSTIVNNSADVGGGIYVSGSSFGSAMLTINDSTISGNSAGPSAGGGGIYASGTDSGNTTVTIRNSTLHTNTTQQTGGGILNFASNSGVATLTIENSTISFNEGDFGGGGIFNSGNGGSATLIITHSTMVGNTMGLGRGIYNSHATVQIGSTILSSDVNIENNSGTVTSLGYNVCNDMGEGFLTATGDQINVNAMTGQLQNNGGPTLTHGLLPGSPAINAGDPSFTPPPDFDQRGAGFPRIVSGRIDVGSFEVQPATPTPTPSATTAPTATPIVTPTPTATPIATPTPTPTPTATPVATPTATTKLLNISTRLRVLTGDNALIGGFIITGPVAKRVIVRAIGPSLTSVGVPGALADPVLELHGPGGFATITNDNWRDTQEAEIEATGVAPLDDLESAIVATLPPGAYTAIVSGTNQGTGVGLVEAYDLAPSANARLANISTRGFVDLGDNVMVGGFILGNSGASARILIRAIGPSLTGVPNALTDPTLELHNSNGDVIAANDDWRSTQEAEIEATGIPPSDDRESAIIGTLAPGAYTAILRGKNDTTGLALVEVYQLASPTPTPTPTPPATPTPTPTPTPSPTPPARFGSLASRAMVGTGDTVTLNTFIVTGSGPRQVLFRGLGPSLTNLGVPGVLADPALDLRAAGGGLLASNNNWRDTQEAEIIATGLPPSNDLESAIVASIPPGSFTVVLRGHTGASGRGANDLNDLSPSGSSTISAVGTRANVLAGSDLLSTGIAMPQGGDILVRFLGPSLSAAGISGVLADPTLELRDGNGVLLIADDNWRDDPAQEALILATGIPPNDDLEAALIINLPPGSYTTLASGAHNGTGIGYVQFYSLPHSGAVLPLTP